MSQIIMKAAGGGFSASGQHSGFDYTADSLTQESSASTSQNMEVCTEQLGKRKRCGVRVTKQHNNLNQSGMNHETRIYDQHLLANAGSQRLVGLSMKTGKRLGHVDHVGPFLANLNQNGRVKTSWNASFQSDPYNVTLTDGAVPPKVLCSGLNQRLVIMQCFRHRMSKNPSTGTGANITGNLSQSSYPGSSDAKPHILFPNSQQTINNVYMPNVYPFSGPDNATSDTVLNGFSKEEAGRVSFCAINRPDLEDMSWNLNKLKLQSPSFSSTNTQGGITKYIQDNVPLFKANAHRRQSILQQNNFQQVDAADLGKAAPTGEAVKICPYKYKACLRYGVIEYELMNKNDLGCQIEFIVYKFKKTASLSADCEDYEDAITGPSQPTGAPTASAHYPLNKIFEACGQGYLNTVGEDYATENLQGRRPTEVDIFTNPAFPLFPTLRKTVASMQPCVEVMRNKFAMSAGSRRTMKVHLPGELYNPCSIRNKDIPEKEAKTGVQLIKDTSDRDMGLQLKPANLSILDEYSYAVVIAVNGQKMTRFFEKNAVNGTSPSDSCPAGTAITAGAPGYPGPGGPAPWSFGYLQQTNPFPPVPPVPFAQGQLQPMTATPLGWLMIDTTLPEYAGWSSGTNYFWCKPASLGGVAAKFSCEMVVMNMVVPANNPTQGWWVPLTPSGAPNPFYCIPPGWDVSVDGWPWASMDNLTPGNPMNWPSVVHAGAYITDFQLVEPGCGYNVQAAQPLPPWDASNGFPHSGNSPDFLDPTNVPYPLKIWEYTQNPPPYLSDCALQIFVFLTDTGTVVPGATPKPPEQFPMGDNYGAFHVDYCATYTEHVGACVYESPSERNLYDCGQPDEPELSFGTASQSIEDPNLVASEHARIILPAAQTVRGTGSVGFTPGATTNAFTQSQSSYTAGGANNGNPSQI